MARKAGLGRGLDALISATDRPQVSGGIRHIPLGQISPNPRQPRTHVDTDELNELAVSIREHGVLQPLIVTYDEDNDRYILITGSRRLMAAGQAGLETVPAIVREVSEQQRLELALIENVQRADLSPLEAAEAYQRLVDEFGLSHDEVASRLGKSRVSITNTLRLLKSPVEVKKALEQNRISEGHARALLALPTPESQVAALQTVITRHLSVRQTEELVQKLAGQLPKSRPKALPLPEVTALEERLRSRLGTRVRLTRRRKGGTLVIYFYSDEEFNSVLDQLLGEEG